MAIGNILKTVLTMGRGVVRGLPELQAAPDPLALFSAWFTAARRAGIYLPETMALATATGEGTPSVRMVLLKSFDARGFVFYTNYESRKALELEANPHGALCFHWAVLQRQVRIEGEVSRITEEESRAYFHTRPRGSQLGAWASHQSAAVESRKVIETRFREYERQFQGGDVPLPPFWGGYRVAAESLEFWQGRLNRLHDRLRYTREGEGWRVERLYP